MECRNCGNDKAYRILTAYTVKDGLIDQCDQCGASHDGEAMLPDVWWNGKPYYSEALGVEFTSRQQKARVMREKGVTELGNEKLPQKNWTEGSRDFRKRQFEKDKPMIRETYKRYIENQRKRG